jgi:hypothetical protein
MTDADRRLEAISGRIAKLDNRIAWYVLQKRAGLDVEYMRWHCARDRGRLARKRIELIAKRKPKIILVRREVPTDDSQRSPFDTIMRPRIIPERNRTRR